MAEPMSRKNLTQKAALNAFSAILDYFSKMVVGFLITPIMVSVLGGYYFGLWQVANRIVGLVAFASGRPNIALKWVIANHKSNLDFRQKRIFVGSSVLIGLLFIPVLITFGSAVSWFAPGWIGIPPDYLWYLRVTIWVLVGNVIAATLANIPQAALQGENLGYKRMGISTAVTFLGGGVSWLFLYLDFGLVGLAAAALIATVLNGILYLRIALIQVSWIGLEIPKLKDTANFLKISVWFLLWNIIMNLMTGCDVLILGFLVSVEQVTTFTLAKYLPEVILYVVTLVVFGMSPGLGQIIGAGDWDRAVRLRQEIHSLAWLLVTSMCATVMIWNRAFLDLWVGKSETVAASTLLLIIFMVTQFMFIKIDANLIDLTLKVREKTLLGGASVVLMCGLAWIMVHLGFGVNGLCIGIILGRSVMSVGYPYLVRKFVGKGLPSPALKTLRLLLATVILYLGAFLMASAIDIRMERTPLGWIQFVCIVGGTFVAASSVAFWGGFTMAQRLDAFRRVQRLFARSAPKQAAA